MWTNLGTPDKTPAVMGDKTELDTIWKALLERIRVEGAGSLLDVYLANSSPVARLGETLVVEVSNRFTKEKLEKEHSREVEAVMESLGAGISNLKYEIRSGADSAARPAPAPMPQATIPVPAKKPVVAGEANLNPELTFDNFIVGKSNAYPHAIAKSVSVNPGKVYNPVYYYGGVGLGKTHLMQAIGHEILRNNPSARVLYVSSEVFHNEYIDYIQNRKPWDKFRRKYRDIDCLLVDDVQFFEAGERIQEEFFHTFEALKNQRKQIVLTGDKTPPQLEKMHERLRSRFASGVVADVIVADFELRVAILKSRAEEENMVVPEDVIRYIAERVSNNIRELRAVLHTVIAKASLLNLPLSVVLVDEVLRSTTGPQKPRELTLEMIQAEVCKQFDVRQEELVGRRRDRRVVRPRQVAMYLCRELTGKTLMEIGQAFGKKDHTTVLHSCSKVEKEMAKDSVVEENVEKLRIQLREKLG